MEEETNVAFRNPLKRNEMDPNRWRSTQAGMWAWIWQRISALAIIVLLAVHLTLPYRPLIQFVLLLTVVFHVTLGLRVILLDFGLVSVKYQKALIGGLAALGAVIFGLVWTGIY
jgi:succinate dehydrogenase / fumarate reductase cytochrome b subunit